jgi:organic radical activating enzyme
MRTIRQKMLNGESLPSCSKCYDSEDNGIKSMRDASNFETYKNSTTNGFYDKPISHIELHFGNVCNLACKMCSQQYSHKIGQELIEIAKDDQKFMNWLKQQGGVVNNWTAELGIIYDWFKETNTKNKIFEYVSNDVTSMSIVGGEPTAITEFYQLLEFCYNKGTLKNKSITLFTNLTNTNPKLIKWLKETTSFSIYCSIDGIGNRNEYIRYPSRWHDIEKSLNFYKDLIKLNPSCKIVFGPTFQVLNIDNLIDMIEYFENFSGQHKIKVDIWWTSMVTSPRMCDYRTLPDSYKQYVANILEKNLFRLLNKNSIQQVQSHIDSLRQKNDETLPHKKEILQSFIKYNDKQDTFRKLEIGWRKLLPKLEEELEKFTRC